MIAVAARERVVYIVQNVADFLLLDMGTQFSSEWSPILRMARMVLIVAEANVPALWTLGRGLLAMKGFGIEPERARVIINRWHKGDDEVLRGIQKDINSPIFACLPNDFRKASQSVNLGTPLMQNHNNVLSNRYRQIAAQLAGVEDSLVPKKSSMGGLFSFSTKRRSSMAISPTSVTRTDFGAVKTAIHRRLIQKLNVDRPPAVN